MEKRYISMNIAIVDDEQTEIDSFLSVIKEYSLKTNVEMTVNAFHSAEEFIKGKSYLKIWSPKVT